MSSTTKFCVIVGLFISAYPTTSYGTGKLNNALTMALDRHQNCMIPSIRKSK
ncbi:hypothetical protein [Vibrio sagamiensis]|uniref:hypothetical protein n=1 Tax=Vibrio sagamiensis TaxID=512650 RepID=UPI001300C81C|nr:hypothetical protein [Vibrio sagamiensis]